MDSVIRDKILAQPAVILDDQDVMRALIEANDRALGSNIVDLRGVAMKRLEDQLDRLEDTHRSVIAAAYENLTGTNQRGPIKFIARCWNYWHPPISMNS